MALFEEECLFVALDHEDLVNLVSSKGPCYSIMQPIIDNGLGSYTGGHVERFDWDVDMLDEMDNNDLYELYLHVKTDGKHKYVFLIKPKTNRNRSIEL